MKKILVIGGTGYIGSHTIVELLENDREVVAVDDFSNSKEDVIEKIKKITGKDFKFYNVDYLKKEKIEKIFQENEIDAVINFAGYKAVAESIKEPLKYYKNNVCGAINLLEVMQEHGVKKFVFSSSATVYGNKNCSKYTENMERGHASSPYGTTKIMIEKILEDLYFSDNTWNIAILRYFNPVGAHESGLIGENPQGIPNNLMPFIMKVANKEIDCLNIYGNDYKETKDGTCARDFLHVVDLAKGHIKALEKLDKEKNGIFVYNLGTGNPYTVQEMVDTFKKVNNVDVPYKYAPRRSGDLPIFYSDPTKAKEELNWTAEKTIEDMCKDSWNFVVKNKNN